MLSKVLKILDKEQEKAFLITIGAEVEVADREGTFVGSPDTGKGCVRYDNGEIQTVKDTEIKVSYCDVQEVSFSAKCDDLSSN